MDEYLCRTTFLYCGGRNGTFDKPFGHTLVYDKFMLDRKSTRLNSSHRL